jgi:PAS domain S-box-containing protein
VRKTEGITSYGYIVKDSGEIVMIASIKMAFRLHDAKMQEKNIKVENQQIAQQWQNTFDSSNDAIWILDKDQNIIRGNKTAEKFFGKSSEEMLGKKCHEIVHQTNAPIPPCPFQKTLKSGDREKMELQNGDIWYQVIVDPIHNGNNELIGAVHLVTDITERKKTEEELKAKLKELQTFHKVTVGRELKMIELKSEVNDLLIKLGQKEKYMIV